VIAQEGKELIRKQKTMIQQELSHDWRSGEIINFKTGERNASENIFYSKTGSDGRKGGTTAEGIESRGELNEEIGSEGPHWGGGGD